MATLLAVDGKRPSIGAGVFLAPTAVLVGDVRIADGVNVWFGAVLRGDFSYVSVGEGSSIQDNCVLHCDSQLPTEVGRDVIVGHSAMLEGCVVEDGALIGMGAIVLQRARVGSRAMVAAGAVVGEGSSIGAGMLAAGVPAREKKELSGSSLAWTDGAAAEYQKLRDLYLRTMKE